MSHASGSPADPVARLLADYADIESRDALDEEGHRIGMRRIELFQQLFAEPIAAAVEPWWSGWAGFGEELRAGRRVAAADELRNLARQLGSLQGHYDTWEQARDVWFRTDAEPWNQKNTGSQCPQYYAKDWLEGSGPNKPWQHDLPWREVGPAHIPGKIANWYLFDQAHKPRPNMLALGWQTIYTALAHPDGAKVLLDRVQNPERLAATATPIGLTIFPAPEIIARWLNAPGDNETLRDARGLFRLAPDAVCSGLRKHVDEWAAACAKAEEPAPAAIAAPEADHQTSGCMPTATAQTTLGFAFSDQDQLFSTALPRKFWEVVFACARSTLTNKLSSLKKNKDARGGKGSGANYWAVRLSALSRDEYVRLQDVTDKFERSNAAGAEQRAKPKRGRRAG